LEEATVEAFSASPQSPQNCDEAEFSEAHFAQSTTSAVPHAAQNFLPAGLSERHFEQRTARLLTKPLNGV
jgi:hypothetical protein